MFKKWRDRYRNWEFDHQFLIEISIYEIIAFILMIGAIVYVIFK